MHFVHYLQNISLSAVIILPYLFSHILALKIMDMRRIFGLAAWILIEKENGFETDFFLRYTDKMRNIFVGTRETDMSDFVLATLLEYESIFFNMDYEKLHFFRVIR